MRYPWLVFLAAVLTAPMLFGASGGTASVSDIAAMANVGGNWRASSTNEVGRAVTTNSLARSVVQQALMATWAEVENTEDAIPLEDVSFPLVSYPDGSVRVQFKADHALLPQDEKAYVRAKGVFMEMFEPGGRPGASLGPRATLSGIFQADNCIFDRATRTGYCEGWVRLQYQNVKITGTNMVWDMETRNVKLLSGARVIVNRFMQDIGKVFR